MSDAAAAPKPNQGDLVWFDVNTPDVAKAKSFYGGLFGWHFSDVPMGSFDYTMIHQKDKQIGGIMPMVGPDWQGVPAHWMNYIAVDDVDAVARRAEELGGKICVPPTDLPVGRFAVITDPAGAAFSLWKSK